MNKACFFDRDGVINEIVFDQESGTAHPPLTPSQVVLDFGIVSTLKVTKELRFLNIIVSNQPNVGLGKITMDTFFKIEMSMKDKLKKDDVQLDGEYFCFHHPFSKNPEYKKNCDCRKPNTGLFAKAAREYDIDLKKSWVIGDGVYDIMAGKSIGCKTILISPAALETGYYKKIMEKLNGIEPDFIIKNTKEVCSVIENNL